MVRRPLSWVMTVGLAACLVTVTAPVAWAGPELPTVQPLPCVDVGVGALGQYQDVEVCPPPIGPG